MLTVLPSEKPLSSSGCVFKEISRVGTNKLQTHLVEDNRFIDCSLRRWEAVVYTQQVAGPPYMLVVTVRGFFQLISAIPIFMP